MTVDAERVRRAVDEYAEWEPTQHELLRRDIVAAVLEASGYPTDLAQCRAVLQRVRMDSFQRGEDLDRALDALETLVAWWDRQTIYSRCPAFVDPARAVLNELRPAERA